jgi:alkylation response protein AidB-like acyl-CoA dehydrogenase
VWALVTTLAGRADDGATEPALVAGALAEAGTLALHASREAVQLHGAFGMTDASPVRRHYLVAPVATAVDAPPAALFAEAATAP